MNPTEIVNSIAPQKPSKQGAWDALRRFFDIWGDPEKRDTTCWNNYYYYYRQIAQHTASISLRRLKWIAILFQAYFFVHMGMPLLVMAFRKNVVAGEFYRLAAASSSMPPVLLVVVLFLIPTVMVCNAFKLKQGARGLMTSRAKEPPLLSHLTQYTTHSGLVTGALQSLFYTWCRFALYMLPAILTFFGLVIYAFVWIAAHKELTEGNATAAVYLIIYRLANEVNQDANWLIPCALVLLVTVCVFFSMQFFCYRIDTLAMMLFIGWLGVVLVIQEFGTIVMSGKAASETEPAVHFMTTMFIPACLFGMAYFILAAADTMHYGLGKQAKWLRGLQLLMAATGIWFFFIINRFRTGAISIDIAFTMHLAFVWSALGVMGLLCDSLALATPRAKNLCALHASRPFPLKFFDVSSPLSLLPILALEIIVLLAAVFILGRYQFQYGSFWKDFAFAPGLMPIKNIWNALMTKVDNLTLRILLGIFLVVASVIHIVLGVMIRIRRAKPQMKEPWNFYARFNSIVLAAIAVGYISMGGMLLWNPFTIILFYLATMVVLLVLARDRKTSKTKRKDAAS